MTLSETHAPTALAVAPRALLLDFGGVIFQTAKHDDGRDRVSHRIVTLLARAGQPVPFAHVRSSLDAGLTALKHWKHSSSRRLEPREMAHREIIGDFIAADYPPAARRVMVAEAGEVLEMMNTTISSHTVRPGIPELLAEAHERGLRVGIVSNAHSGRSHRRLLAAHDLDRFFDVQVYSDEVGIRKPHPGMIELAARALGVSAAESWYVGDTLDRDVVVGRRAGVGAVIVTRAQHTDSPPFAVAATPDALFDTPEGVLEALRSAVPGPPASAPAARRQLRPTLFIDHGGVISTAVKDPAPVAAFASELAHLLSGAGEEISPDDVLTLIGAARERYADFKQTRDGSGPGEITPHLFWVEYVGSSLSARQRALLEAEAADLMVRYARAKSRRSLRFGVEKLLRWCRAQQLPVVVVSNTMSGRVVREECARYGLADLIGAYVCSDEVGARKPERRIVDAAVALADADPSRSWFLGDKPQNDAVAARDAGIARRVLVRGGSTAAGPLADALAEGLATDLVDDALGLLDLMKLTHPTLMEEAR